jgi:hypothetical protein
MKTGFGARIAAVITALAGGCGGESESDRDRLFSLVSGGSVQRAHACREVRDSEISVLAGGVPAAAWEALRARIQRADIEDVTRCLAEVREYNACFYDLPCTAFESREQPAWLYGSNLAPCGCGISSSMFEGPFVLSLGPLPDNLASCVDLLPLGPLPPHPGFTCP